jgi:hypothetical protein
VEAAQVLSGLLEHASRQFALVRVGDTDLVRLHRMIGYLFQKFLKPRMSGIFDFLFELPRHCSAGMARGLRSGGMRERAPWAAARARG